MDRKDFFDAAAADWKPEVSEKTIDRILDYIDIQPGHHVLDVGTGTGILLPYLLVRVGELGRIHAADFSQPMLAAAQKKHHCPQIEFLLAPVTDLPLPAEAVDRVVCFSAFPHFPDHRGAVTELCGCSGLEVDWRSATQSRDRLNSLHREVGGAVKHDMVPHPDRLSGLLTACGLLVTALIDSAIYVVTADKP